MNTTTPTRLIVEIKLALNGQPIGTGRTERRGNVWRWLAAEAPAVSTPKP